MNYFHISHGRQWKSYVVPSIWNKGTENSRTVLTLVSRQLEVIFQ